jgi:hypothetical protein
MKVEGFKKWIFLYGFSSIPTAVAHYLLGAKESECNYLHLLHQNPNNFI